MEKVVLDCKIDFRSFFERCDRTEHESYIAALTKGHEIDFTNQCWGHAFYMTEKIGSFGLYGHGHYGKGKFVKSIVAGDYFILQNGKFLVLKCDYQRDPSDMFFAYIVCVEYR